MKMFTLCLNMIVKDESHCIIETLTNLCSKVEFDYWVICDTGSTDNTMELIQTFFDEKGIRGELHEDVWVDFGHNRTLGLQYAYGKTDFLLIFDADDTVVGDIPFPDLCDYDSYRLQFGSTVKHERTLLINNRKQWKFTGVLHEYLECLETSRNSILVGDYYIISGKHGNRSKDPEKYKKDALILEKAYQNMDNLHTRYSFYCANSYRDAGDTMNAIHWYKNTLTLDNWSQEKYVCCLSLYSLYDTLKCYDQCIYYLLESYTYDKTRVEGIYHLIKHYSIRNENEMAFSFYSLIQSCYDNRPSNTHKLFVDDSIYSFYLPYYMIIVCEKLKKYDLGLKMYEVIFENKTRVGEWWIKNLVYNLTFFIEKNKDLSFVSKWNQYVSFLKETYPIDKDLLNTYEIQNISKFLQMGVSTNTLTVEPLVVAILAKDKGVVLPFYLQCLYAQTYPKSSIHLYIRTNDNKDDTETLLQAFMDTHGKEYASVYFDNTSVSEQLKQYSSHEWNEFRFKILSKIRQDSVEYAKTLKAHYFVADCDNFIIPTTIESLMRHSSLGVIAPMLRTGYDERNFNTLNTSYNNPFYSNYHYDVTPSGYYKTNDKYHDILKKKVKGLIRVCCVHCTYLIPLPFLSSVNYLDDSRRYEYVVFSEFLRKNAVPQYIDNTLPYGYLTFSEEKEDFDKEQFFCKERYSF